MDSSLIKLETSVKMQGLLKPLYVVWLLTKKVWFVWNVGIKCRDKTYILSRTLSRCRKKICRTPRSSTSGRSRSSSSIMVLGYCGTMAKKKPWYWRITHPNVNFSCTNEYFISLPLYVFWWGRLVPAKKYISFTSRKHICFCWKF